MHSATTVAALHAKGREVACYFSAGSYENWRSDADRFPESVKGASNGWLGERWIDGFTNATGFPLTASDQLAFNVFVANAAHARGLSIALKNDLAQIPDLVPYFDWAVNEQCAQYHECELLTPFSTAGKAVMQIEYVLLRTRFCPAANLANFNALKKRLTLGAGVRRVADGSDLRVQRR